MSVYRWFPSNNNSIISPWLNYSIHKISNLAKYQFFLANNVSACICNVSAYEMKTMKTMKILQHLPS